MHFRQIDMDKEQVAVGVNAIDYGKALRRGMSGVNHPFYPY
ncbi:hypothetical protein [Lysinibacillus sphaericus]|nr:hypothetical protein [Lysinibacillus sphaericus]